MFTFFPLVCLYSPYWSRGCVRQTAEYPGWSGIREAVPGIPQANNKVDLLILKNTKVSISKKIYTKKINNSPRCSSPTGSPRAPKLNIPHRSYITKRLHAFWDNFGPLPARQPRVARHGLQLVQILRHRCTRSHPQRLFRRGHDHPWTVSPASRRR